MARRVLKKLEMDEEYQGNPEVSDSCYIKDTCYFAVCISIIYFVMGVINLYRPVERITQLNPLKAGGRSVLSWMWALLELLLEIVFLVL